jgi:hypothetical protein
MEKKLMIKGVGKEESLIECGMSHSSSKTKLVQLWGIGHLG